jgi:hypothetical protein
MSAPRIVIQAERKPFSPITVTAPNKAWRAVGQVGVVLAVVAAVDVGLRWYPLSFRSPEWEFGTVAISLASLPLGSIGLAAALASALARGSRIGASVLSGIFCLMSLLLAAALLLFLSDLPLAFSATKAPNFPAAAALEMKKTVVRSLVMGVGFGIVYVYGAVASLKYLLGRNKDA